MKGRKKSILSTHILDVTVGLPAVGVKVDVAIRDGQYFRHLGTNTTDSDGRIAKVLFDEDTAIAGEYELLFHIGDYFNDRESIKSDGQFLNRIPIHFTITSIDQHHHVPLLVSPWAYSTYKGS